MRNHIRFTKEEKEEDIQLVLEALKEGQSYSKIAIDLGRSIQYIANIKIILIERGLITQEEIDFFSNANSTVSTLKKPVLQKLQEGKTIVKIATELKTSASTITKVRNLLIQDGLITLDEIDKSNKTVNERESLKNKILEGFFSGKLSSEISTELRIAQTTISRIKRELISQGIITEQEILDLQNKSLNERKSAKSTTTKNDDLSQLSEQEKQIIVLLLKGYPLSYISKMLDLEQFDLTDSINKLKKGKHITSSQINEARNKFKQNEEKNILTFLRRGYSQADILQKLTYLNNATLSRRVTALVNSGEITQEQIEQYRYEAPQGEKEIMQFVLSKLQLGFTVKEIIEADENGFLTERRVRDATAKLVQNGSISTSEIEKAKANRKAQKRAISIQKDNDRILSLIKEGKSYQDIADEMGVSYEFVWGRATELKDSGKLTPKQLQKSKKQKKDTKYSDVYGTILLMLNSGYTQQEIAKKIGKSMHFVIDRIQELKEDGKTSDKSIQKAKRDRIQRKKQIKEKHQSVKYLILNERIIDNSTTSRFVSSCQEMFKLNMLSLEDIPVLRKAIEYTHITQYTISFMLRVYVSFKQYDEAIKFLNSCIGYLTEDPSLIDLSKKGKSAILYCQKQQQAVVMLKEGIPVEYVFRKVGLTESEVIELNKKYTDSDDNPPIFFGGFDIEI